MTEEEFLDDEFLATLLREAAQESSTGEERYTVRKLVTETAEQEQWVERGRRTEPVAALRWGLWGWGRLLFCCALFVMCCLL
jgi:hypothetical protein